MIRFNGSEAWDQLPCPSPVMQRIYRLAERIAATQLNLLISGEAGVGRAQLARLIHRLTAGTEHGFRACNWKSVRITDLDHRLFRLEGPEPGLVPDCESVTLFFPDLNLTGPDEQSALLQLILRLEAEDGAGALDRPTGCRVIGSASPDLWRRVASGEFRSELYERLRALEIRIPALRERPEDIEPLARGFFARWKQRYGLDADQVLTPDLIRALECYPWPGNVAELKTFLKRMIVSGETAEESIRRLEAAESPSRPDSGGTMPEISRQAGAQVEREVIRRVLQANGWNRRRASEQLRISYRSLLDKMKRFEIR